jgi:hypothetical protein
VSAQDYRVNAEARRLLVSRWVDVSALQVGTTNGVIYVLGRLDTTMEDPTRRQDEQQRKRASERHVNLVIALEKDLRRLRDVRDVVFKLDNVLKRGGRWRAADGTHTDTRARRDVGSARATLNGGIGTDDSEDEVEGEGGR